MKLALFVVLLLSGCAAQQGYYNTDAIMPDSASLNWSPTQTTFNMKWE